MTAEIWEIDEKGPTVEGLDAAGRPDPAYAAALGLRGAPFGRRFLAVACDIAIWVLLQLPLWIGAVPLLLKLASGSISTYGFLNHPGFTLAAVMAGISVLLSLVYSILQLAMHGVKGLTIGKAIAGIRSVNVRSLEKPGIGTVLLRVLILVGVNLVVPVVGPLLFLISAMLDPQHRGRSWHDRATKVWLIDVRDGLDPYDEKRMRVARKTVKAEPTIERAALPSLATPVGPGGQPEYRPGNRVSAGVLGVARPQGEGRPIISSAPVASAPAQPVAVSAPVPPAPVPAVPVAPSLPAPAQPVPAQAEPPRVAPGPESTPVAQPSPVARFSLRLDTGESILIAEPVLLGRNPDASEHPGAKAVALADDSRSLSKTHMLVRPVDGGLEVVDCRSTNGSGLIRAGVEYGVTAGVPVITTDGDSIRLGDRVAVVVRV